MLGSTACYNHATLNEQTYKQILSEKSRLGSMATQSMISNKLTDSHPTLSGYNVTERFQKPIASNSSNGLTGGTPLEKPSEPHREPSEPRLRVSKVSESPKAFINTFPIGFIGYLLWLLGSLKTAKSHLPDSQVGIS